jgi:hypothetical protein
MIGFEINIGRNLEQHFLLLQRHHHHGRVGVLDPAKSLAANL